MEQEKNNEDKSEAILEQLAALLVEDETAPETNANEAKSDEATPAAPTVDVEALQAENERLKALIEEYDNNAQKLLDARLSGLSAQRKEKVDSLFVALKAENPLQKLTVLRTVQGATSKPSADNTRSQINGPTSKPKNLKELRGRLSTILNAQR